MLVHFRLNVPQYLSDEVLTMLENDTRVTNLVLHSGASVKPRGDAIEADVAREAASFVLDDLDALGLDVHGGIVISQPMGTPFRAAEEVERQAHGDPDDAVIWRLVERSADVASRPTYNYLTFLIIATSLASIAVLTDSSVLVVGAMVVGPEFATVAAVCVGAVLGKWALAGRALWLLTWSFVVAILAIAVLSWLGLQMHFFTAEMVTRPRPQTGFIWRPDKWSFIVAVWAGAAGVLALAIDKTSAMVGVFISVTTVPAAGNLALGLATRIPEEIIGSAEQLGMNIAGMILAGIVTLVVQRMIWRRLGADRRFRLSRLLSPAGIRRRPDPTRANA